MASLFLFVFWSPVAESLGLIAPSTVVPRGSTQIVPTSVPVVYCYGRPGIEYRSDVPLSDEFMISCNEVVDKGLPCPSKPLDSAVVCQSLSLTATRSAPLATVVPLVTKKPTSAATRYPTFTPIFRP